MISDGSIRCKFKQGEVFIKKWVGIALGTLMVSGAFLQPRFISSLSLLISSPHFLFLFPPRVTPV
jgi:hypothetical protein